MGSGDLKQFPFLDFPRWLTGLLSLSKVPEFQERGEEALPIVAAIGANLGIDEYMTSTKAQLFKIIKQFISKR